MTNESPAFLAIFSAVSKTLARRRRQIELALPAAHLGERGKGRFGGGQGIAGTTTGALDQPGGKAFRIVEQHLEEVFGRELLVTGAKRPGLRRLHEAAGAVGVLVEVHLCLPFPGSGTPSGRAARRSTFSVWPPYPGSPDPPDMGRSVTGKDGD